MVKTGVDLETLIAPFWPAALATEKPVGIPFESRPAKVRTFEADLMSIACPLVAWASAFFDASAGVALAEGVEGVAEFVAAGRSWLVVVDGISLAKQLQVLH